MFKYLTAYSKPGTLFTVCLFLCLAAYNQTGTILSLTIGANNVFDVYQDLHHHSGNMSSGRFVYSRRVQQRGFNGAYYFARLKLALPTSL